MTVHAVVGENSGEDNDTKDNRSNDGTLLQKRRFSQRNDPSRDVNRQLWRREIQDPAESGETMNPLGVDLYSVRNVLRLPIGVTIVNAVSHSTHTRVAVAALCSNGR